jgi:hypothetical protein
LPDEMPCNTTDASLPPPRPPFPPLPPLPPPLPPHCPGLVDEAKLTVSVRSDAFKTPEQARARLREIEHALKVAGLGAGMCALRRSNPVLTAAAT